MISLLLPAGYILITWLVAGALFILVGACVVRPLDLAMRRGEDLFLLFWIGWALTLAYLQLWQLAFPVDLRVYAVPVVVGVLGCVRHGRAIVTLLKGSVERRPVTMLLMGIVALWAANKATAPLNTYDAGLYHLSTIRWLNSYPIVPGLGNLHGRLAFNSSFFLYEAMLNLGPWAGKGYYVANSLLVVVLLTRMVASCVTIMAPREGNQRVLADYFLAILFIPTLAFVLGDSLSTTSTDVPVFVLQIVVSAQFLHMLSRSESDRREDRRSLLVITLLAITGILVKLSFFGLALPTVALAMAVLIASQGSKAWYCAKTMALAAGIVLLTILPWMARGVILSGYAVYPSTLISFPVEWRVPVVYAKHESDAVIGWARAPGPNYQGALGNWNWLRAWYVGTSHVFLLPLLIAAVVFPTAILLTRRRKGISSLPRLILVPQGIGIVAWFFSAPDPRFAGALFWMLAAGSVVLVLPALAWAARLTSVIVVSGAALAQSPYLVTAVLYLVNPGPVNGFYNLPTAPLRTYTTASGLKLNVPVRGDQTWNAPLPSTPYPDRELRLRCPGTLSCGFTKR